MTGEPINISPEQFAVLLAQAFVRHTSARPEQAFAIGSKVRVETSYGQVFHLDISEVK